METGAESGSESLILRQWLWIQTGESYGAIRFVNTLLLAVMQTRVGENSQSALTCQGSGVVGCDDTVNVPGAEYSHINARQSTP